MAEGDKKKPADARAERLAEALRANLRRRKAQAKRRGGSDTAKTPPPAKQKT
ncbi:MAG: hypothetical protein AAF409_05815 [Pseudomonadota bacterium]